MVRAILFLAENFGLDVTAEGVEEDDQRTRLRDLGCESAQGYLFGRPMPGERVIQIMKGEPHNGLARWPRRQSADSQGMDQSEKADVTPPAAKRA